MFGILAIFSGLFMTHDPVSAYPDRILQSPSAEHWFGTDSNGMDVFSRVIYGAKFGFGIAIRVTISVLIGVPVGLIAGYRGGILDEVLMRIFDGLRVFPSIILALAVVAATGQSLINVVLVLGFLDSPVFARLVRAEVLTLRSSIFVKVLLRPEIQHGVFCFCIYCLTQCRAQWHKQLCEPLGPFASARR